MDTSTTLATNSKTIQQIEHLLRQLLEAVEQIADRQMQQQSQIDRLLLIHESYLDSQPEDACL